MRRFVTWAAWELIALTMFLGGLYVLKIDFDHLSILRQGAGILLVMFASLFFDEAYEV